MPRDTRAPAIAKGTDKRGALQKADVEIAVFLVEWKLGLLLTQYHFEAFVGPLQIGIGQLDRVSR